MAHYSVATTKDNLSRLIDKALAGEEVVITRHGRPTVSLAVIATAGQPERTKAEWSEWLREGRERLPPLGIDAVELVRKMREDGAH